MLLLDAFFRFSGVGVLLFSMVLAIRDLPKTISYYLLLLTGIALVCHYLGFTPKIFNLPAEIRIVLRLFDVLLLPFVWLFCLSLFQKDFKFTAFHLIFGLLLSKAMLAERLVYYSWVSGLPSWWALLVNSLAFIMIFHMVLVTLTGRHDDLLEKRRNSRLYLVYIIASSATLTIVLGSLVFVQQQATVNAISLWPAIVGISIWLTKIEPQVFAFDTTTQTNHQQLPKQDVMLLEKLQSTMSHDKQYLENNLSVNQLALILGVGAPRLRKLINQQLNFTNFSSYVNSFRIKAIKDALDASENDHLPILTLALNHGFNSLPPFNRAFKKIMGLTPSEYRNSLKNVHS